MSKGKLHVGLGIVMFVGLSVTLVGCAQTGVDRADDKIDTTAAYLAELQNGKKCLVDTSTALDGLLAPDADLRAAYGKYCDQLLTDASVREDVKSRGEDLKSKSKVYFDAWSADLEKIDDPDMKRGAEEAKSQARARFERIQKLASEGSAIADPLFRKLDDIKTVLANELSADGVGRVKPAIESAKAEIAKLIPILDKGIAELGNQPSAAPAGASTQPPTK